MLTSIPTAADKKTDSHPLSESLKSATTVYSFSKQFNHPKTVTVRSDQSQ